MALYSEKLFKVLFWFAQLLIILCIVLTFVWVNNFLGGFGWQDNPRQEFNYHIVLAVIGQVVLYGEGMLIYRAMRYRPKTLLKALHGITYSAAFICTVISLKTVFDSHNLREVPIANLYSIHSWTGLGAVILFAMQLCCGFAALVYPGIQIIYRKEYIPLHKFFGITIFILSVISCHSGIMEKVKASIGKGYRDLPPHALVANFVGIIITVFAVIVIYLVIMPEYRRKPLPEEDSVNMEMSLGYGQF